MLVNIFRSLTSSQEIVDAVTVAIREGEVSAGDELPSIRMIARISQVSPGTVALAFRVLRDRGIITTTQGRRAQVSAQPVSQRWMSLQVPENAMNLAVLGPDPALLPDVNTVLARGMFRRSLYDTENVEEHLRSVASRQFASDGIRGELTVTSGALDALERVFRIHLTPGDSVIVEDPNWGSSLGLMQLLGLTAVGAEVDEFGITPEALKSALASRRISAILLTPRAQNPFGSAMSPERATTLRQILDAYPQILVIEDDHAGPVSEIRAVTVTEGRSHYAVIRSVNKALGPDLRVATIMSDDVTADGLQRRMFLGPGWVPHFVQRLVATMFEDPDTLDTLEHARNLYAIRRETFLSNLACHGVIAHGRSGLNVAVPVPDETAIVSRLLVHGWAVRAGSHFRLNSPPFIRICTSTLEPEQGRILADAIASILMPRRPMATP